MHNTWLLVHALFSLLKDLYPWHIHHLGLIQSLLYPPGKTPRRTYIVYICALGNLHVHIWPAQIIQSTQCGHAIAVHEPWRLSRRIVFRHRFNDPIPSFARTTTSAASPSTSLVIIFRCIGHGKIFIVSKQLVLGCF